jgi:hypothetical protein
MDYSANASHLAKWQWDIIQNPAVFAGLTDKDEEGMYKQQDLTELIQIMQGLGNSQFLVLRNCEENQYYSSDAPKTNIINMNNKLFKYIIGTYIPDRNTVEIDKSDKTTGKNIDDKTYSDLQIDKDAKEIVLLASDNGGVPVIVPCYQGVANRYIELCGYDINSEISTSTIEAITNDIRNCLVVQPAQSGRIHNYSSEKIENAEELEKLYGGKQKINDPTAGERHNTKAQLYITDETTSQEDLNRIREITQNKDTVIWLHKTSSNEWEIKSALPQMLGDAANLMKEANQAALKGIDAYAEFMYEALDYVANAVRVLKVPRYAWDDKDAHYKRIYAYVYKAVITVGTGGYYNAVVQLVTSYGLSEMIGESNPEIANVLRQMGDGRVEFAFTAGVWDGAIETVAGALNLVSLPYKAASEKGRQEIVNTYNQLKDFELVDEDGNVIESGIWAALKMGMKEEVSSTYRISHFSGEIALGVALCFVDPAALEAAGQKAIAITVRTLQFFDEIQGMAMKPLGYTLKFVKKAGGKIIGRVMKEGTLLFEIIDDKLAAKAKRVGGTVEENIDIPTDNIKQISKGADDKIILETKNGTKWELEGVAKGGDRFFKNIDEFKAAINRGEDVFYLGKYSDMRPRPANVQGHHGVNSVWMEHN